MSEAVYRLTGGLAILVGAGISIYYRQRANRNAGKEKLSVMAEGLPLLIGLRLSGTALWLGVFAYLINPAWMRWSQLHLPTSLRLSGVVLGLLADGLIFWVFSTLGDNVSPTVVTRSKHRLVTSGPYRWVRHPLYSVGFLSYMAFALLSANWYIALLTVSAIILISLRIPKEEEALAAQDGDAYREYASRTGRFFPKLG